MTRRARCRGAVVLTALLVLASCGGDEGATSESGDGGSLVLYTGREKALVQPLIDDFEAESGIEVDVRYGNSAEMAAQLLEEGEATPAEVFLSQEVGAAAAVANGGLLVSLPDDVIERPSERFRPHPDDGNRWIGVTARSRVIAYHPDLVEGAPPEGVLELTDPEYRDMVAWVPSNPSFQAFITAFRVTRGDEAASKWLDEMIENGAEAYENNVAALEAVNAGDIPIALINHYYWARSRPELGDDLVAKIVFPKGDDPGGLVNATAVGITTTGEDSPEALEFVRYLLSDEGQHYFVEANFEYPVVPGIENPEGVPPLADLQGPAIDLSDLESLEETQQMLIDKGLIS